MLFLLLQKQALARLHVFVSQFLRVTSIPRPSWLHFKQQKNRDSFTQEDCSFIYNKENLLRDGNAQRLNRPSSKIWLNREWKDQSYPDDRRRARTKTLFRPTFIRVLCDNSRWYTRKIHQLRNTIWFSEDNHAKANWLKTDHYLSHCIG